MPREGGSEIRPYADILGCRVGNQVQRGLDSRVRGKDESSRGNDEGSGESDGGVRENHRGFRGSGIFP